MTRIDLMISNGTIKEFRPATWRSKIACQRASARRLRYVCAPDVTLWGVLETLFWLLVAGAFVACAIGFPVLFVRWCLCL